ncbi:hypothetical protein [Salinisphaera sp. T31B1]|uniref:hypothetical protein n=1 Tax=Salinisphaera sp. T31B1 TaxID=727963 RepID=UPI00333F516F
MIHGPAHTLRLLLLAGLTGIAGCSDPGGTAILHFGKSNPIPLGGGPLPASLRESIQQRLGEFGALRIEAMDPIKIRHDQGVITHRYRLRVTFVDALDDTQRQAIRDLFDTLVTARDQWPRGLTLHGETTTIDLGDRARLIYVRRNGLYPDADAIGAPPTHCTVSVELNPPVSGGDVALVKAMDDSEVTFDFVPLQRAYDDGQFTFFDKTELSGPFGASDDTLYHAAFDFGVIGTATDLGPMGGMASPGSTDECITRISHAGRPFTFNIGWTLDRTRRVELDFPEAG